MRRTVPTDLLRSFVFGVEDSVVSTVGMVSGIAAIGTEKTLILVAGLILILVEAFSMAAGNLMSDNTIREVRYHSETPLTKSLGPALVMFVSYLVSGFIVLVPYMFWEPERALPLSLAVSLALLFALGAAGGKLSGTSLLRNASTMAAVGGLAAAIGIIAGYALESIAGRFVL